METRQCVCVDCGRRSYFSRCTFSASRFAGMYYTLHVPVPIMSRLLRSIAEPADICITQGAWYDVPDANYVT
ncbi:hypothetical protein BaRGS_00037417, partial [Batillaria attramentaria]